MSLLGNAAMASWHDMQQGAEPNHDDWHSHQHIAERVGIPGFLRGRRYRAVDGPPEFFIMYEVDGLDVLTSDAYQQRLNSPTDWTREIVPTIRNMCRTLCRVLSTHGSGVGAFVLSIRFRAEDAQRGQLIEQVTSLASSLSARPGVVAAHLLEGDAEASGVKTDEARMRGGDDRVADLALIVEGYDLQVLRGLRDGELSAAAFQTHGAHDVQSAIHQLAHVMSKADL